MSTNNLIDTYITDRAGTTKQWLPSDTFINYANNLKNGKTSSYGIGEIEYKFNNHGFRCDEFELPSELPIVFLGCSITEGIGLHQRETWSYQLLEKIREKTKKNIPYWNLALGASGIDTQVRNLYFLTSILNVKVDYVFFLLPTLSRREYKLENNQYKLWLPKQISEYDCINRTFSDSYYSKHQVERSLMILDSICRQNNTKAIITSWDTEFDVSITKDFPLMDTFKLRLKTNSSPPVDSNLTRARDLIHPGPIIHQLKANNYWDHVEKYF
jgi:hypothetical protein